MPAIIPVMDKFGALAVVLFLVAWFGIWIKYGTRVAFVVLMVAGALIAYMFYAGVFNTTR